MHLQTLAFIYKHTHTQSHARTQAHVGAASYPCVHITVLLAC